MGIKELWPFLNPYCMRKPLFELQGKTVAIDLAGWICESLCVVDYEVHARFYLRNLFFRTCYLLLSGITPVFVLDGTAPVLKHQMIAKRNQIQFRGARPRKNTPPTQETQSQASTKTVDTQKPSKGRTRFNYVLKQCEDLIRSMGLQCVQGPGEAEAFCAHLNAAGLVDGVISQDSDCFAYGARRVFRNFSLSMQGSAGSIGGSIDIYDLDVVQKSVDFGRNKIVVMALLCGCDYCPDGVGGVGRDAVQKLFAIYSETDIMERIRMWRKNDNKFTELELKVDDKKLCVNCGHYGRVQSHTKSGCAPCKMSHGCDASIWKEKRLALKSELQIRKKAMQNDEFPSQEIIDEFMQEPIDMGPLQLDWCQPNLVKFVKMMGKLIQWDEIYCFQKFLPLLTRWQLYHIGDCMENLALRGSVQPDFIKKKRTPKGVPSYEIIWKDEQGCFNALIPDNQLKMYYSTNKERTEMEANQQLWSTIEPMDLVEKAYPDLVSRFEESKLKGKSKAKKVPKDSTKNTKKSTKAMDEKEIESESSPQKSKEPEKIIKAKKTVTRVGVKTKKKKGDKLQPIDQFFQKKGVTSKAVYESPKIRTTTKPMNLSAFSLNFDDSLMHDDDMNLSTIINDMVTRPPSITEVAGKKLRFDEMPAKDINQIPSKDDEYHDFVPEIDRIQDVTKGKENIGTNEPNKDESMDEFDMIVMRKNAKSGITKRTSLSRFNLPEAGIQNCSTPVTRKRYLPTINASHQASEHNLSKISSSPNIDAPEMSKNRKNSVISSSFFAMNAEDEIDLFEKSIDFRNMEDVESDNESEECSSPIESSAASKSSHHDDVDNGDDEINQYDTFDRLVGLA